MTRALREPAGNNRGNSTLRSAVAGLLVGGLAVFGIVLGVPDAFLQRLFPSADTAILPFALMAFGGPLAAITAHELGHLTAGLAQGFRFELFVVGPLGIRRRGDRVRIYLNRDPGMMGGIAATSPRSADVDTRSAFARILLAGPLASLLPRTGLFFTDRKRWQRLRSGGREGLVEATMVSLVTRAAIDGHHKGLTPADLAVLQADDEPFVRFVGDAMAYLRARDLADPGAIRAAATALDAHRSAVPASLFGAMGLPSEPSTDGEAARLHGPMDQKSRRTVYNINHFMVVFPHAVHH